MRQSVDYDIETLIEAVGIGFKKYIKAIGVVPVDIDFRHFFSQEEIAALPDIPIVTHKIVRTTPAALKGRPFSVERDYGARDHIIDTTEDGTNVEIARQYYETLASFGFFSNRYEVIRELSREFRNYISLFRTSLKEALRLPDIFFWQRTADNTLYVKGTLLYTCEVQIYIKTLSLLMVDTTLIKEIIIDIAYEYPTI